MSASTIPVRRFNSALGLWTATDDNTGDEGAVPGAIRPDAHAVATFPLIKSSCYLMVRELPTETAKIAKSAHQSALVAWFVTTANMMLITMHIIATRFPMPEVHVVPVVGGPATSWLRGRSRA